MNDFSNKTYAAILAAMLQRIPDTFDKRDTSPIPTALGPAAYTLEEFYLSLNQVQKSAFVQTAVGTDLDRLSILGSISHQWDGFHQFCSNGGNRAGRPVSTAGRNHRGHRQHLCRTASADYFHSRTDFSAAHRAFDSGRR